MSNFYDKLSINDFMLLLILLFLQIDREQWVQKAHHHLKLGILIKFTFHKQKTRQFQSQRATMKTHFNELLMRKGQSAKSRMLTQKKVKYAPEQIEDSIETILKNQSCKTWIQSLLIASGPKLNPSKDTSNVIPLEPMMFQVYKENILTDLVYSFPCSFQLPISSLKFPRYAQKYQFNRPKPGSFIRVIRMAFDVKQLCLVIFEYQYLGGAGSEIIGGIFQPVKWDCEKIKAIIRNNIKKRGSAILLESHANKMNEVSRQKKLDKFQMPAIKLHTAQSILQKLENKGKEEVVEQQKIAAEDEETKAEYFSNSD